MAWVERLAMSAPHLDVMVQHGLTSPPACVAAQAFLAPDELQREFIRASAVVTHGGPGSIADAARAGHRPVVVPRRRRLGEHVDDHQMRFATRLVAAGEVALATDEDTFRSEVWAAVGRGRGAPATTARMATVARFEVLVDELVATPRTALGRLPLTPPMPRRQSGV